MQVRFAKCCTPVPGDDITGYITKGRGVSVHRKDCPSLEGADPERCVEVFWTNRESDTYKVEIQIMAMDRTGLLSEITRRISEAKLNVSGMSSRVTKDNLSYINVTLSVRNSESLTRLIETLKTIRSTIDVYRVKQKG